jgi:hypothetical protein
MIWVKITKQIKKNYKKKRENKLNDCPSLVKLLINPALTDFL